MRPVAKGWCPGAHRPMMSGDGLIVRVRPRLGRLSEAQALGLAEAARTHGSGLIDLTSRANLQLRGVREDSHGPLLEALGALGLLDDDPASEARRNIIVTPFWTPGDVTAQIAEALADRLNTLPELPPKFGFAIDAGPSPVLRDASADVRVERGVSGGLILRADGADAGWPLEAGTAVERIVALTQWFTRTAGAGRVARHLRQHPLPGGATEQPAVAAPRPLPAGKVFGLPFGQMHSASFAALAEGAGGLRLTPWRLILSEAPRTPVEGFLPPEDPLLQVDACPGAPFCPSATVETRALARRLAPFVPGLHVSGCAKGCARPRRSDVTLTGNKGRFDLVRGGHAWDMAQDSGMTPETLLTRFGAA